MIVSRSAGIGERVKAIKIPPPSSLYTCRSYSTTLFRLDRKYIIGYEFPTDLMFQDSSRCLFSLFFLLAVAKAVGCCDSQPLALSCLLLSHECIDYRHQGIVGWMGRDIVPMIRSHHHYISPNDP